MKKFQLLSCIFGMVILLSSCASQHRLELVGHYKPNTEIAKNQASAPVSHPEEMMKPMPSQNENDLVASANETTPDLRLLNALKPFASQILLTEKQEKKLDKKLEKVKIEIQAAQSGKQIQQNDLSSNQQKQESSHSDVNTLLLVILSILLPPLAVYLYEDDITTHFWVDLILTFFLWIPGVIFALVVVLGGLD